MVELKTFYVGSFLFKKMKIFFNGQLFDKELIIHDQTLEQDLRRVIKSHAPPFYR